MFGNRVGMDAEIDCVAEVRLQGVEGGEGHASKV